MAALVGAGEPSNDSITDHDKVIDADRPPWQLTEVDPRVRETNHSQPMHDADLPRLQPSVTAAAGASNPAKGALAHDMQHRVVLEGSAQGQSPEQRCGHMTECRIVRERSRKGPRALDDVLVRLAALELRESGAPGSASANGNRALRLRSGRQR